MSALPVMGRSLVGGIYTLTPSKALVPIGLSSGWGNGLYSTSLLTIPNGIKGDLQIHIQISLSFWRKFKNKEKKSSLCYRFKPQPLSPFYLVHYSTQNAFSATKNKNKTKKFFKKKDQKKKPKSKAPTRKNKTWGRD